MTVARRVPPLAVLLGAFVVGGCGALEPTESHQTEAATQQDRALQALAAAPPPRAKLERVAPAHLRAAQQGLARRLSRSAEGLKVRELPDGRKAVGLEGRFQSVVIANHDESGNVQMHCASSAEQVAAALGH